jgi:hypothetical protein
MNISDLHRRVIGSAPKQQLLLDEFTNAAAAYSLRLLSSSYTGNCIEVRRSSDNALQNIGFVNGVLDTASLLSWVGNNNGFVSIWYDQSGNNRHAVQNTTTRQPQIIVNGDLILYNNKPCLKFTQSNQQYFEANFTDIHHTISIVCEHPDNPSLGAGGQASLMWGAWDGVNVSDYIGRPSGDPSSFYYRYGTLNSLSNYKLSQQTLYFADLTKKLYDNNTLRINVNSVSPKTFIELYIGTRRELNSFYNYRYQELIIWRDDKSLDRLDIQNEINGYYNIF